MRRWLLIPLLILLVSSIIHAQSKDVNKSAARDEAAKEKAARDLEAERILKERRANAQSLLVNLATDARNFTDQALRARTLARIADALWEADRDRGRTIFRAAWDAAEIADREGEERFQEARRQAAQAKASGGQGRYVNRPPDIRREVLRLATKHDRALGEEFLAKLKTQKKEAADERGARARTFGQADEATRQRLSIARELLRAGDTDQALQFADPALTTVSIPAIDFLSSLREKDPAAADRRYAAMLATAAANPQSDANMVSWLSSYVFTPHFYATFGNEIQMGGDSDQRHPPIQAADVRQSLLITAATILLRPLATPAPGQTSVNDGQSMVIRRLLPLFEQFARPELTASLRSQLVALETTAGSTDKRSDDKALREGLEPEQPEADWNSLLDRLEHARTAAQRDDLRVEIAERLASKGDLKAREYVEKIDDTELRNRARAFIDATLAAHAVEAKKTELALEISRIGELTHLQKSWLLAQTAKLLATKDRDKALSLIEESAAEARRMDNSDADRPRAFLAVANALLMVNPAASWDVMSDAIKAANSADTFSGEDGRISLIMETKQMGSINNFDVADFDVAGIFGKLANEDFDKSIELARGFERQAPRANATIAIARSVLEEKKK